MNLNEDLSILREAPVGVLGLGKSGLAAGQVLEALGAQPIYWDQKNPQAQYNDLSLLLKEINPKLCVLSPGVPRRQKILQDWESSGGIIWGETELGSYFLKDETVLGVTGSLGKSTVSAWLAASLKSMNSKVFLGGNFGTPLCEYVLGVLKKDQLRSQYLVLELSSYQLESISKLIIHGSIITNFYPNHLDRYLDFQDYCQTKWNLLSLTKGPVVLNSHSKHLMDFLKEHPSQKGLPTDKSDEIGFEKCRLKGGHNRENYALVNKILKSLGVREACQKGLENFGGLEHRVEFFYQKNGISFVNDSKSTTVESVLRAIDTVQNAHAKGNIWILLGGRDKNLPWQDLKPLARDTRLNFLVFGEAKEKIASLSELPCEKFDKLEILVKKLPHFAQAGDCVLLSPGGTSLDEFRNFEERGAFFKNSVEREFS